MTFSRSLTRYPAAALLAACLAAGGAKLACAAGQAAASPDTAAPPDAVATAGPAADPAGGQGARGDHGFGPSRPGAPGLDGPTHDGPAHEGPIHDRLARGGATHDGPAHDRPAHDRPTHDGPAQDGPRHDGPPHGPGGFGLFGNLHRLHLSEAQQDKLFALMHGAAPLQRSQAKAERRANEALRAIAAAPQFDETRAAGAARELGRAVADGALLRARLDAQVLALLTPGQREQWRRDGPPGPPDHP